MVAILMVSQVRMNAVMYNLTSAQAEEFIGEVKYVLPLLSFLNDSFLHSKHLAVFKDSSEFGWEEVKRDVRRHIFIKNRSGGVTSIKSYACALKGDGKIDRRTIRRRQKKLTKEREGNCVVKSFFFMFLKRYAYI